MILQRTPMMIALSAVLGLGGAWMIGEWLGTAPATVEENSVLAVVVSEDTPAWQAISIDQLSLVSVPEQLVPEDFIEALEPLIGQYAQVDLFAGEILLSSRVSPQMPSAMLANRLKTGMRAMTVRINDVSGVAGFVQPGSRVDVIANERNSSRMLLSNREVLAIDQATTMQNNEPVIARTATLAVTPSEATQLAGAIDDSALFLALRNSDEPELKPAPKPAPTGLILQRGLEGRWVRVNQ